MRITVTKKKKVTWKVPAYLKDIPGDFPKWIRNDKQNGISGVTGGASPFMKRWSCYSPVQRNQPVVAHLEVIPNEMDSSLHGPARIENGLQERVPSPAPSQPCCKIAEGDAVLEEVVCQSRRLADQRHRLPCPCSCGRFRTASVGVAHLTAGGAESKPAKQRHSRRSESEALLHRPEQNDQDQNAGSSEPFWHTALSWKAGNAMARVSGEGGGSVELNVNEFLKKKNIYIKQTQKRTTLQQAVFVLAVAVFPAK